MIIVQFIQLVIIDFFSISFANIQTEDVTIHIHLSLCQLRFVFVLFEFLCHHTHRSEEKKTSNFA